MNVFDTFNVAVVADSTGSHNNGWASGAWPDYLETLARKGGALNWKVDNFSVPGLTWNTAHIPTPGFLIGAQYSPVEAVKRQPKKYDLILCSLAVNSRTDPIEKQLTDSAAFLASLPDMDSGTAIAFVGQHYILPDGTVSKKCAVTLDEAKKLEQVCASLSAYKFYGAHFGMLHEMGFSYDEILHQTNSGKQLIASSVYAGMQADYPLTPISLEHNISSLYAHPELWEQFRKVNT